VSARPPVLRTCRIPPSSIKLNFHPQFLIAIFVLTCFSIAGRTRPSGRASTGSVTSGDWFSDCIDAAYVCVVVGSPRSNSTRIDVSTSHRKIGHICPISFPQAQLMLFLSAPISRTDRDWSQRTDQNPSSSDSGRRRPIPGSLGVNSQYTALSWQQLSTFHCSRKAFILLMVSAWMCVPSFVTRDHW
jgi:hypothetical protein